jgi:hypothetical protein
MDQVKHFRQTSISLTLLVVLLASLLTPRATLAQDVPPEVQRLPGHGWWLLPMTGQQTLFPPVLYGLGDSREVGRLNAVAGRPRSSAGAPKHFGTWWPRRD